MLIKSHSLCIMRQLLSEVWSCSSRWLTSQDLPMLASKYRQCRWFFLCQCTLYLLCLLLWWIDNWLAIISLCRWQLLKWVLHFRCLLNCMSLASSYIRILIYYCSMKCTQINRFVLTKPIIYVFIFTFTFTFICIITVDTFYLVRIDATFNLHRCILARIKLFTH